MLRAHNKWFLAVLSSPCRCHMVQSSSSGGGVSVSFPVQLNETPILSRYLYVWVMRWNPVCVKPTHTGLYSKWSSFATLHSKRNLVNSLLRRAYDTVSSYELVHTECMNIKRMLSRNGYPNNFWTVAFSNSYTVKTVSHNNVVHRLNPLLHPNIFHYNYRIWVLYLTAYGRSSAVL